MGHVRVLLAGALVLGVGCVTQQDVTPDDTRAVALDTAAELAELLGLTDYQVALVADTDDDGELDLDDVLLPPRIVYPSRPGNIRLPFDPELPPSPGPPPNHTPLINCSGSAACVACDLGRIDLGAGSRCSTTCVSDGCGTAGCYDSCL